MFGPLLFGTDAVEEERSSPPNALFNSPQRRDDEPSPAPEIIPLPRLLPKLSADVGKED